MNYKRGHGGASAQDRLRGLTVRILFGKRISWLGLEKAEAFGLAQALIKKARQLKKD